MHWETQFDPAGGISAARFDICKYKSNSNCDIYLTRSTDSGGAFSTHQKVNIGITHTSSLASSTFIGDYSGNAAGTIGTTPCAHPAWRSGSYSNGGDLRTAALH